MTAAVSPDSGGFTLEGELAARLAATPDKTFVSFDDNAVTFAALEERVTATANQLLALGVQPGETVALFMGNCAEWIDVLLAAARIGALSVPVNVAFRGDFLAHQLRDSRAVLVVVDQPFAPRLFEVAGSLPDLRTVVVRDPAGAGMEAAVAGAPKQLTLVDSSVLADGDRTRITGGRPIPWNEPASLFYTSGTTGPSKGVALTQHYLVTAARTIAGGYGFTADDVIYGTMPLFHFGGSLGVVLPALVTGLTSVLDSAFHPATTWDRIRQYNATVFAGVGPMVVMLWSLPPDPADADVPIRIIMAAPIPPDLHRPIEERYNARIVTAYGMTEAFPVAMQTPDRPVLPGSAGRPVPQFEVRIVDDADREVPAGEAGEIVVRPRQAHCMFEGYFGRAEATLAQFRNLWFHTGDMGRFDAEGNLFFADRKKDAIRRRGENISSFEIERGIVAHPAVAECAAVAVPSPVGEDDVKVCVVLKPDMEVKPEELLDHCAPNMPYFAVPRYIEFVAELPKNATNRVLKFQLREAGVTGTTWDRDAAGYVVER